MKHDFFFFSFKLSFGNSAARQFGSNKAISCLRLLSPLNAELVCNLFSAQGIRLIVTPWRAVADSCLISRFQTVQSYFATVKLIYTVGYSISLAVLSVAVFILLLFRCRCVGKKRKPFICHKKLLIWKLGLKILKWIKMFLFSLFNFFNLFD